MVERQVLLFELVTSRSMMLFSSGSHQQLHKVQPRIKTK